MSDELSFIEELSYVSAPIDEFGRMMRYMGSFEAFPYQYQLMQERGVDLLPWWRQDKPEGSLEERIIHQHALWAQRDYAFVVHFEADCPKLLRLMERVHPEEVWMQFVVGYDSSVTALKRALWDIGIRRLFCYADPTDSTQMVRLHNWGYVFKLVEDKRAKGILTMDARPGGD